MIYFYHELWLLRGYSVQIRSLPTYQFSFLIQFSDLCQCTWIQLQNHALILAIYSCKVNLKAHHKFQLEVSVN